MKPTREHDDRPGRRTRSSRAIFGGIAALIVIAVAVVTVVLVADDSSDGDADGGHTAAAYRSGFVYRTKAQLMLDGAPYRFVGVNNYDLTGCHTGDPASEADANAFFAGLPARSVTRVWAFEEWGLEVVQQTVRIARAHNQKVVLVLADGAENCKAPVFDVSWYRGGYKGAYVAWVNRVVTTFRDSPEIAFWELMNEPGIARSTGLTQVIMKRFYDDVAARIKKVDANHLVSTGAMAPWQEYQKGAAGYRYVHSGRNIDLVSFHEYDYPYSNGKDIISAHFAAASEAATRLGKPIYIGETGVSLKAGCMTAEQRAAALKQKFDAYLSAGAAGVLYWVTLGPPNNPGVVCNSDVGTRDPMIGGAVMDMIGRYQVAEPR